ncbi:MAG: hypothetical protein Q7J72_00150 [Candidatus Omnitrophota bacterium]|nr:hypothetical protein [Candidatus Omnitrophota bacterium]
MKDIGKEFKLKLFINGRHTVLKPFLKNFIKQIVLAMVFNLDGIKDPKKIELVIEKEGKGDQNVE